MRASPSTCCRPARRLRRRRSRHQKRPIVDIATPGVIRTIVIDPGHGGDDAGAKGAAGVEEKDVTLQIARRLKATIESRASACACC